jgi:hypothetical protein
LTAYALERKRIDSAIVREVIQDLSEVPLGESHLPEVDPVEPLGESHLPEVDSVEEFLENLVNNADESFEDSEDDYTEPSQEERDHKGDPVLESSPVPEDENYDDSSEASNPGFQNSLDPWKKSPDQQRKRGFFRRKFVFAAVFILVIVIAFLLYGLRNDAFRSNEGFAVFSAKNTDAVVVHKISPGPEKTQMGSNPATTPGKQNSDFLKKQNTSKQTDTQQITVAKVKPDSQEAKVFDTGTRQTELTQITDTDTASKLMKSSSSVNLLTAAESENEKAAKRDTVIVKRGESLMEIISKAYGKYNERILNAVLGENPDIQNPNLIFENQTIKLPRDIEEN